MFKSLGRLFGKKDQERIPTATKRPGIIRIEMRLNALRDDFENEEDWKQMAYIESQIKELEKELTE